MSIPTHRPSQGQPASQPRSVSGSQSGQRNVDVLQTVVLAAVPLRLDELASATGLTRAAAHGVLEQLRRGGLVDRDADGRWAPGWVLHGLRPEGPSSVQHAELALDEEFAAFVSERLTEEVVAATSRREHAPDGTAGSRADAGLRLLHDLLLDLEVGVLPDDVTLHLLARAYAAHPDFRNRWRHPAALLQPPVRPTGTADC